MVPVYGDVVIDQDEEACLKLPGKFRFFDKIKIEDIRLQIEVANSKIRWFRMSKEVDREGDIIVEEEDTTEKVTTEEVTTDEPIADGAAEEVAAVESNVKVDNVEKDFLDTIEHTVSEDVAVKSLTKPCRLMIKLE